MGLTLTKVEDYRPVPGKPDEVRLIATNHYIRIRSEAGGPLFIQNGKVYAEGGEEIKDLPQWFQDEVKKVPPAQLKEVRYSLEKESKKKE